MFKRIGLTSLDNYFTTITERGGNAVYFCRIDSYSEKVKDFLAHYINEVKKQGVYIKGKIQNPDERQLAFFDEMIGRNFSLQKESILNTLKVWLPRLNVVQRTSLADALTGILEEMSLAGKNTNIQNNAFIKFMCWFYYKFERILTQLGQDKLPKILYEGDISDYEMKGLRILSGSGCDVLLIERNGDQIYSKVDPGSVWSELFSVQGGTKFPKQLSLIDLGYHQTTTKSTAQKGFRFDTSKVMGTNIWLTGEPFQDSLLPLKDRGQDTNAYYNMFVRIRGVEDKNDYQAMLLRWKLKLENMGRTMVIVEHRILMPDVAETSKVKRRGYTSITHMIGDLMVNISCPKCKELEVLIKKAFAELLGEQKDNIQAVSNRAICLIVWINRYIPQLFRDWKIDKYPVFLLYGTCGSENEALFLRLLSKIPVDVIVLCPDLERPCKLQDKLLFEKTYDNSLLLQKFPVSVEEVSFTTAAFNAEQDLNQIMYQDTGMYRNKQFKRAVPVVIRTTYEEIGILWDQEAKYRPNFEVLDDKVMVPVIFSKISGVKDGDRNKYWDEVSKMITPDTFVIKKFPYIQGGSADNPVKQHAASFFKNGKVLSDKIKNHPSYQYGYIREDMQDYIFDKIQQMIHMKIIAGTLTQGIEYTILAVALNMDKSIIRLIQKYDFTKTVPKAVFINTKEDLCSVEDSIFAAFLSIVGFDILIFTPTGYQSVERFFVRPLFVEHQIGDYIYDLTVPNFKQGASAQHSDNLFGRFFKRGK